MMYFIQSTSQDPYYNLALEQYVFDELSRRHSYFMLWQNHNTIVVGKHQNTLAEINPAYVKEKGITVVRRLSGGGAVYHDLGNLNFTFITDYDHTGFDFALFCQPVAKALATMGITVQIAGRNDMTIDGKKFSGNSQYMKQGRVMHHGTLMYDSNLETLMQALNVPKDKFQSKGIPSVKSRVTNIRPYMREDLPVEQFINALRDSMFAENSMKAYQLTDQDQARILTLRDSVYSQWDWNYGASPQYSIRKSRRIEGCGKVEIFINVKKGGIIEDIAFYGDYFGNGDSAELAAELRGKKLAEEPLKKILDDLNIGWYFNNLTTADFLSILLQ